MIFKRIAALLLAPCLMLSAIPAKGTEFTFTSEALAPVGGFYHPNGTKTKTAKRGGAESRKVRGVSNDAIPILGPFEPTWLDPEMTFAALGEFLDEMAKGNGLSNFSRRAGMVRLAQRIRHRMPDPWPLSARTHRNAGDISMEYIYKTFGAPHSLKRLNRYLGLAKENDLKWEDLPISYNILEKAAAELVHNFTLFLREGENWQALFEASLINKLWVSRSDAKKISDVFADKSDGMEILSVLIGQPLLMKVIPLFHSYWNLAAQQELLLQLTPLNGAA